MALQAVGLTTHIWNNNIRSVLLLLGFPLLLVLMLFAFFYVTDYSNAYQVTIHPAGGKLYTRPLTGEVISDIAAWREQGASHARAFRAGMEGVARWWPHAFGLAGLWFVFAWFTHGALMRLTSHAVPVTRKEYPQLYNMLENLCLSRGLAMPKFQVIDTPALNAFASGIGDKSYTITLTRGLIDRLEPDELEAVIAHELTHIVNRDVRLMIIAYVFVGMLTFFADLAWQLLRGAGRRRHYSSRHSSGSGKNNGGGGVMMLVLIGFIILIVGRLFAIVIQFALSRRREFLADAGAVELTQNPGAMMRALLRISGGGSDRVRGLPDEVRQMCIVNSSRFMGLFRTHPPIEERVRILSEMTHTPVPDMAVSLRRGPRRPWPDKKPPAAKPAPDIGGGSFVDESG